MFNLVKLNNFLINRQTRNDGHCPWGWMPDKRNAQAVSSPKGEKLAEKNVNTRGEKIITF
jgi:hypothetical protein